MNYVPRLNETISGGVYRIVRQKNLGEGAFYKRTTLDYVSKFYSSLNKWRSETYYVSSTRQLTEHPSFKTLVGMGEIIIPLLLSEIRREPSLLVLALASITGESVAPPADRGSVRAMTDAWLSWGKQNGY